MVQGLSFGYTKYEALVQEQVRLGTTAGERLLGFPHGGLFSCSPQLNHRGALNCLVGLRCSELGRVREGFATREDSNVLCCKEAELDLQESAGCSEVQLLDRTGNLLQVHLLNEQECDSGAGM